MTASARLAETWQPNCRGGGAVLIGKWSAAYRVAAEELRRPRHIACFGYTELGGADEQGRGASR